MKFKAHNLLAKYFIFLSAIVLFGCVGTSKTFQNFSNGEVAKPYCYKEVNVSFPSNQGNYLNIDIEGNLKNALKESLEDLGKLRPDVNECGYLDVQILNYKAGSSFLRWMLPGAGETKLSLEFIIKDDKERIYNTILSKETITAGGLFSINQSKLVVNDVLKNVEQLI